MLMTVTLRCSPHWRILEDAAIAEWLAARQRSDEPLIIVPSSAMRDYWLSRLAEKVGGVNGDAVTVLDYLAQIIAAENADKLWRLAKSAEQRLAAWDAFAALDNLPKEWKQSGVVDAFLDTVEELELDGLTPERVEKVLSGDERIVTLVQAWQLWKERLHERGLWSIGDVLCNAIQALRNNKASLPPASYLLPTCLLIYGFTALTDLRWDFLHALLTRLDAQNGIEVHFFVLFLPDNQRAFSYALPLMKQLYKAFGVKCTLLSCDLPAELQAIQKRLFKWQKPKEGELTETDRIVCVAAAGEEQEVEMALRLLTQWRREGKLQRYSDALLVAHSLDAYLSALEAISARYNVPFVIIGDGGRPSKGLAQLLWSIADARHNGWDGETLWRVLPSPYLRLVAATDVSPLLGFIRKRMAETGASRWAELLQSLDAELAQRISGFLNAVEKLPLDAPADEHAKAWQRLLTQFVKAKDVVASGLVSDETSALRKLHEQLNALRGWKTFLSLEEFVGLLESECLLPIKEWQDALRVATIADARGIWMQIVIVLGLSDERFPQMSPVFELLTDKHRDSLKERYNMQMPLKYRRDFFKSEWMYFAETVGAAIERLVLTYPRTDAEGRPRAASLFVDATENALKAAGFGWKKIERDLADVLPRDLSEAINNCDAEALGIFKAFSGDRLVDSEKAVVAGLLRHDAFRERLRTEWLRWAKPQEGAWDGKGLTNLISRITHHLQTHGLHVTALEDYGHCPYRFFAKHILRLERPMEVTYAVDPSTVGVIWHKIMECFLKRWKATGQIPDVQELHQIAEKVVGEQTAGYPKQVWMLLHQCVFTSLPKIWQAEQAERQKWTPVMVEQELTMPAPDLGDLPEALKELVIKMRPDRVDENEQSELRIADYKTGDAPGQTKIKNGVAFQLPLYALKVGKEMAQEVAIAHFIKLLSFTEKKGYSIACVLSAQPKGKQMSLKEAMQSATDWARRWLHNIAEGDFTVFPYDFSESCRNCDFRALCRRHPLRIMERGKATEIRASD